MVGHRIDQVVGELSVAHPGIAQQIEVALIGLQIAKVVDGVEVRQARVVQQVLLRDAELGQQRFGNAMQRFQRGAFFPFAGHLTPAEILGVLLERRQLRQGVIAHQELGQRGPGRIVQYFREQPAQPPAFGGQGFADQLLQGGVAWPNDLVLVEPDDQLGGDEPRNYIASHDQRGLLRELWQEAGYPRKIAKQLGDPFALGVVLVLGDRLALERLVSEIASQHEGAIFLDLVPVEAEERVLGLEVADLQDAIDLGRHAGPAAGERQFSIGQGQIFQPLGVVEIRQAIQGFLLGVRQNGQSFALGRHYSAAAREAVVIFGDLVRWWIAELHTRLFYSP